MASQGNYINLLWSNQHDPHKVLYGFLGENMSNIQFPWAIHIWSYDPSKSFWIPRWMYQSPMVKSTWLSQVLLIFQEMVFLILQIHQHSLSTRETFILSHLSLKYTNFTLNRGLVIMYGIFSYVDIYSSFTTPMSQIKWPDQIVLQKSSKVGLFLNLQH